MCLIVCKPAGADAVPLDHIQSAIHHNSDGFGFAYAAGGRLVCHRDPATPDADLLAEILDRAGDAPLLLHFRFATAGAVDLANAHPFLLCGGRYAFAHNGTARIPAPPGMDNAASDTARLAYGLVEPLLETRPDLFGTPFLDDLLQAVAPGSKFAILRNDGAMHTVGHGSVIEGRWYSNTYSLVDETPRHRVPAVPFAHAYSAQSFDGFLADCYGEVDPDYGADTRLRDPDEDDFDAAACLQSMEYDELCDFVYSNPDRAADALYALSRP